jgi:hypothetical protein
MTREEAHAAGYLEPRPASRHPWRRYTAWWMSVALALIALMTVGTVAGAGDASAPQLIQAYTEGLFYAAIVIGVGLAVYIGTRADD